MSQYASLGMVINKQVTPWGNLVNKRKKKILHKVNKNEWFGFDCVRGYSNNLKLTTATLKKEVYKEKYPLKQQSNDCFYFSIMPASRPEET